MTLGTKYLVLCLLGVVLPYMEFVPWLMDHGFDLPLFARELFANRIGGFFALDVVVSAVVLLVFIGSEGRPARSKDLWAPVAGTLLVGVSFGLPLFLYLLERRRESNEADAR